ncbi:hypothetical protein C5B42_06090 [Candidatus Cerribacteria bacterium 'Amazon FNV 2010 28 9']|uniref:Uncharacterized protein n=1 Tax=Candidatus Cerribacteria bacterium 'Amazon FNV 2010 28 9' TaxID=2081795 RepID=A0A317JQX0_9BACT|nr:MAG: hypothetical protein C5B42_06090 [Candidatus Cerribacteria bacterium 'Amazon FNV 2010 28 9']
MTEVTAKYHEVNGAAIQPWEGNIPVFDLAVFSQLLQDENREVFDLRFIDVDGNLLTKEEAKKRLVDENAEELKS